MSQTDSIKSCQLTGFAGIMIQVILGTLSFSVLIYKRYTEVPKRQWKIWFMDTSKQGVSQMLAHITNVLISMQLSSQLDSDACIWYFTTNVLDNTVGVAICITFLSIIEKKVLHPNYLKFQSGNYYTALDSYEQQKILTTGQGKEVYIKPFQITKKKTIFNISYFDWLIQFIIWNLIVVISKILLFQISILLSEPLISVSTLLIGWIQPYQTLQLILVIIIVPVIMNGLAFWFQDNFLKKKQVAPSNQISQQIKTDEESRTSSGSSDIKPQIQQNLL